MITAKNRGRLGARLLDRVGARPRGRLGAAIWARFRPRDAPDVRGPRGPRLGRRAPRDLGAVGRRPSQRQECVDRRGQHATQAAGSRAARAVLENRGEIQDVSCACEADVEQALGLLALERGLERIGVRQKRVHRHRRLAAGGIEPHADRPPALRDPAREIHQEDDRELEPLRRVDGHQADRVDGLEQGVGFVANGQPVDVRGDAVERRIAPVLDAADERPELLHVLPRLPGAWPRELERISASRPAPGRWPRTATRDRRGRATPGRRRARGRARADPRV